MYRETCREAQRDFAQRLFLAGSDFELIVDHRHLVPIINSKTLDELSTQRILRMKEKLAPYRIKALWRQGIEHKVVDCLSRNPVETPSEEDLSGEAGIEHFHHVLHLRANIDSEDGQPITDLQLSAISDAGNNHPAYQQLKEMLSTGFPEERSQLPPDLHPYWDVRQDLSVDQGIILLGQRLVIPAPLRPSVLRSLHASHQGETRTLRRARQVVFWPKMTNDIRNRVRSCSACATFSPSQPFEPVLSDQRADRPFEKCAADLFQVGDVQFLVFTDRFSGWPFVGKCGRSATTASVVSLLKQWFTFVGASVKIVTDGGPQFRSQAFADFCAEWRIDHESSSPYNQRPP